MELLIYFLHSWVILSLANGQGSDEDTDNTIPSLILACKNQHCRITQMEYLNNNSETDFIISACPAPENINNQSFTNKSLLARVYKTVDIIKQHPKDHFCQSTYEPSMVLKTFPVDYDDPNYALEYNVGYELYFVKNSKKIKFISKIVNMKLIRQSSREMTTDKITKNYRWFSVLSFKFNRKYASVHQVHQTLSLYDFDGTDLPSPRPCAHYNLGKELFEGLDVENLYSFNHQFDLFTGDYLSKMRVSDENTRRAYLAFDPTARKELFDVVNERLSMHQLVSLEDFPSYQTHQLTCTYMNTIPLWEKPAYNWILINAFVRELARHIKKLEVFTGTFGITQFPEAAQPTQKLNAFLYRHLADRKIPIPNILFKAIRYPVYLQNPENEIVYYSFIIVMHNSAEVDAVTEEDRICEHNACEQLGCALSHLYFHRQTVYCCRADEETLKKLNLKDFPPLNDFNLKAVDLYADDMTDFQYAKDLSKVTRAPVQKLYNAIVEEIKMKQPDRSVGNEEDKIEKENGNEHHLETENESDQQDDGKNSITVREEEPTVET